MAVKCPKCHSENPETLKFCGECGTQLIPSSRDIQPEVTETLQTAVRELTTGSTFAGRYQVIEELGKGGMGSVYKVYDAEVEEKVALKLLNPEIASDEETIKRFRNELKLARAISHKNVCRMHDLGQQEGVYYITMEYVAGENLKSFIRRSGQLNVDKAIGIAAEICEGLAEAHRLGVVHRDLKPQNIMIDLEGNAQIMDFGIARSLKAAGVTGPGVIIGTPEYMSPEQVQGEAADQRSDIYAVGVILYEMLTGRVPFGGDTPFAIALKHKAETPPDPREFNGRIPEELSRLALRCLEKDRDRRFQSSGDLLVELREIGLESRTTAAALSPEKPLKKAWPKLSRAVLVPGAILGALVILAVAVFFLLRSARSPAKPEARAAPPAAWKNSIAVLPFKNMSADPEQEYFCEGIAEELLNALTQIKELRVVARMSAFSFKGKDVDIREIGRTLNVDKVLEGSVRKSGQRLRITAQLVNVEDGYHIWSDQFDREIKDIFAIQEEISLTIVDHLKLRLLKSEKEKILKRYTEDHEAYDYYLKGRYFWYRRYEKGMQRGLQYFQQAIEKDPGYALPHVGIADTFGLLGVLGFMPPHQAYSRAKAAAKKALEIDPEMAEAYTSLGMIAMWYDWDWPAAEEHFLKAIQKKPEYALVHHWYGNFLSCMGRFDESIREMQKACELEPLEPVNPAHLGLALFMARRFDESIGVLRKVIESDPELWVAHWYQSMNLLSKKMWGESIATLQKLVELTAGSVVSLSYLGFAYGLAGMKDEAFKILERLDGLSKDRYVGSLWRGVVWLGLGEKNKALENLEKAYAEREGAMAFLKVQPILDSLRSEPRFQALLKKMNLDK